jgi:hypothetical protein
MFECLTIYTHEEDILDGMLRLDQTQKFLKMGEFLLSHFVDFFDFVAGDRLHCSFLTRDDYGAAYRVEGSPWRWQSPLRLRSEGW